MDPLNLAGEEMGILVVEFDRHLDRSTERQTHCLVWVLRRQSIDVSDEDIEHDYLIAGGLLLFHNHSYLTVRVECPDCFVVFELYDRSR